MADLSDVPLDDLVAEMRRRLECQSKPEKHVILIGPSFPFKRSELLIASSTARR